MLGRIALVVALAVRLPSAIAAQEIENQLYRKFELDLSGDLLIFSTTLRVDAQNRPTFGTEISAENDLGLARTSFQPRAALRWRLGRRNEIEVGLLRAVRSNQRVLGQTISFNDTTFGASARTESSLRTTQAFLNYRYAVVAHDATQIGATLGLGIIFMRAELDAIVTTARGTDSTSYSAAGQLNGPVISIGPYGRFRIGQRWYLETDGRGVYLKISNYTETVVEGNVAVRRFFSNTFGAELGYGLGFYSLTVDRPSSGGGFLGIAFRGAFTYTVNGLRGGIILMF